MSRVIQTTFNGLPLGRLTHVGSLGWGFKPVVESASAPSSPSYDGTIEPNFVMATPRDANTVVETANYSDVAQGKYNAVMAPDESGHAAPLINNQESIANEGSSMWGTILGIVGGIFGGGSKGPAAPSPLNTALQLQAQEQLAAQSTKRTIMVVATVGGVIGFGSLLFFLARKK